MRPYTVLWLSIWCPVHKCWQTYCIEDTGREEDFARPGEWVHGKWRYHETNFRPGTAKEWLGGIDGIGYTNT